MHGIFHRQITVVHVTNAAMRKLGRCGLNMAQIMALEDTYFPAYL
jgi:hypothetical protein